MFNSKSFNENLELLVDSQLHTALDLSSLESYFWFVSWDKLSGLVWNNIVAGWDPESVIKGS